MGRASFSDTVLLTYQVGEGLAIRLVELCNWRPDFPRCRYCGASEFWHVVWPAGLALARYLASGFPTEHIRGRRALVVGCGVGLESVVLAKLGAQVSALDHVPMALQLVQRNCALNALPPVQALWCCWRDGSRLRSLGQYDLLIGGDVLYEPADAEWLHALLTRTLKRNGRALFADPLRGGVEAFFQRIARAGFSVQSHRTQTRWIAGRPKEIQIYQVERHQGTKK